MTVTIPQSIADIKLHQFQKYNELLLRDDLTQSQFDIRKVEIFTNIKRDEITLISSKDFVEISQQIDIALNQTVEFQPTFFIQDVEFGFITNFDKISQGEFIDISNYGTNIDEMHKLMAVLFRPIKKKDSLGNYEIISYQGTDQYANIMKHTPMNIVNGALVFFSSLASELVNYTQKYMMAEQVRDEVPATISTNGDGMLQSMN